VAEPCLLPPGVRCIGGVTRIWARVRNLGTLHVMPKENHISGTHEGGLSPARNYVPWRTRLTGRHQPVVRSTGHRRDLQALQECEQSVIWSISSRRAFRGRGPVQNRLLQRKVGVQVGEMCSITFVARNPHAAFDVAGAGNVTMVARLRAIAKAVESPPAPIGVRASSRYLPARDSG
jgi:hypothetical protein